MNRFRCFWLIFPSLLMFCLESHTGLAGTSVPREGLLQFMAARGPSISMFMWPNLTLVFLHWIFQVYQQLHSLISTWHSTLWHIFSPWCEHLQYKKRDLQDPQEKVLYIIAYEARTICTPITEKKFIEMTAIVQSPYCLRAQKWLT